MPVCARNRRQKRPQNTGKYWTFYLANLLTMMKREIHDVELATIGLH
jgi:hypothetical protein